MDRISAGMDILELSLLNQIRSFFISENQFTGSQVTNPKARNSRYYFRNLARFTVDAFTPKTFTGLAIRI